MNIAMYIFYKKKKEKVLIFLVERKKKFINGQAMVE